MPVADNSINKIKHVCNGVATQLSFPFVVYDAATLIVKHIGADATETTLFVDTNNGARQRANNGDSKQRGHTPN